MQRCARLVGRRRATSTPRKEEEHAEDQQKRKDRQVRVVHVREETSEYDCYRNTKRNEKDEVVLSRSDTHRAGAKAARSEIRVKGKVVSATRSAIKAKRSIVEANRLAVIANCSVVEVTW